MPICCVSQSAELNATEASKAVRTQRPQRAVSQESEAGDYGKGVNCVIIMTNGKTIGVSETCQEVGNQIFEKEKQARHVVDEPGDYKRPDEEAKK